MAVNRDPVLKRCRSLDLDPSYLGYAKKSKRNPKRSNKKMSEYALQLREKQKAKFVYGVLEKQFRGYFEKAERQKGVTGENLLVILESRFDNIVYRAGFAATRRQARQFVTHNHFTVNGKKANIPSMRLKVGDVIQMRDSIKGTPIGKDLVENLGLNNLPAWLELDAANQSVKVARMPQREEIDIPVEEQMIVELYSK